MPTIASLLAKGELELELHCGDPQADFRAVRHVDRLEEQAWLAPGELRLVEDPSIEPRSALRDAPAAILFGLTPTQRELPAQLLRLACEQRVAFLSAPAGVNLDRVERTALRLLVGEEGDSLSAAGALMRYLAQGLESVKPEREIIERLHHLTGASFLLRTPWSGEVARAGRLGWPRLDLDEGGLVEGRHEVGGQPLLVLRVARAGTPYALLLARDLGRQQLPLLETARMLLEVVAAERRAELRGEQARRSTLLAAWLSGKAESEFLGPRMSELGIELDRQAVVAVAEQGGRGPRRSGAGQRAALQAMRQAGDEMFAALAVAALSDIRGDTVIWAFPASQTAPYLERLERALSAGVQQPVRLGMSIPGELGSDAGSAYFQALLALQSVTGDSGSAIFSELDPVYWVLQQQPLVNLRALRDRMLGELRAGDKDGKLWRTLAAYLRSPDDIGSLAEELHVHPNTLRYRLRRIEELTGKSLGKPANVAELYLAERIDRMLERGVGTAE